MHSHRAPSDEQHALGPLYLCAVTNARRRSLHSVLQLPRHTKQQQQEHRSQRTRNLGGLFSPAPDRWRERGSCPPAARRTAAHSPDFSTALQPTKRMRHAAKNAEGKRACCDCCCDATAVDASSMRSLKLSAHSITRSPTKERAVGYTVASVVGVVGGGSGVSGEW